MVAASGHALDVRSYIIKIEWRGQRRRTRRRDVIWVVDDGFLGCWFGVNAKRVKVEELGL